MEPTVLTWRPVYGGWLSWFPCATCFLHVAHGSFQVHCKLTWEPCECSFSLCEHDTWHGMQVQYRQSSTYMLKIARVFIQVDFFAHWRCSSTTMFIHWLIASVESLEEMQKWKGTSEMNTKNEMQDSSNEILRKQRHHAGIIRFIGFSQKDSQRKQL